MGTKVLITGHLHETAVKAFENDDQFEVTYAPDTGREQLLEMIGDKQVLVTRSETAVDRDVLERGSELKVVARAAVGVGNIDIDHATEKGILVVNCPGKNTNSAAELTLGLIVSMLRNVPQAHGHFKGGGWDRHRFTGREIRGKKIGIVGLGNVGHRVAKFARGFDLEVYAYDPYISPQVFQKHGVKPVHSLKELAAKVDILSVHTPLNKETRGLIDGKILDEMADGTYVVNCARGGIIEEEALLSRLNEGKFAGAAIDTWENEPKPMPDLLRHDKVWCTPHIGASTLEAQIAIGKTVYAQVKKAVEGGVVDHPVNLPQVAVIDNELLKSYAVLAEKLGSLVGQILEFNPEKIEVGYRGDLANLDQSLVRLGLMKGYASQVVDSYVSFVNVESHFENLGLNIAEKEDPGFDSYKSALTVWVHGPEGQTLNVGGIVFDDRYARISLINDFVLETEPYGDILLVENDDRPGVIGDVGHFLSTKGINIDSFALSRNRKGGRAMALVKVDTPLAHEHVKEMHDIKNIIAVHAASL